MNPHTEKTTVIDIISLSEGSEYVINPASDTDGIIYFPTGMHHGELWSYNPDTEEKIQILPKELMTYGPPTIWRAENGKVYGKKGKVTFLCTANKIIEGETQPSSELLLDNSVNGLTAMYIDGDGNLVVKDQKTQELSRVKSSFDSSAHEVFSIGAIYNGKLYGSSMKPGNVFSYNLDAGKLEDLGKITRGGVQVYDILAHQNKLFMTSYTGGYIDRFDIIEGDKLSNRKGIANLHAKAKQERLTQLVLGSDSMIYAPTVPIRGYVGGGLVSVDPENLEVEYFPDIVPNQSLTSVTPIPDTGELFITTSTSGGTSAKATEKGAYVFIWDPLLKKITYKEQPIDGAKTYSKTVRANNGLIYGSAASQIYVFDPQKREVINIKMKDNLARSKVMLSETLGVDGFVYGVDSNHGKIFSINPENQKITFVTQDSSLINTRFAEVKEDGFLYYSNDANLLRVNLMKE